MCHFYHLFRQCRYLVRIDDKEHYNNNYSIIIKFYFGIIKQYYIIINIFAQKNEVFKTEKNEKSTNNSC